MSKPDHDAPAEDTTTGFVRRHVDRWRHGMATHEDDWVAEEMPIAMIYNGVSFSVMMATPHDLRDFALGFSLSEGLIDAPEQLLDVQVQTRLEGIELAMRVAPATRAAHLDRAHERLLPGRSGCGMCGTRDLEQAIRQNPPMGIGRGLTHDALEHALDELQLHQPMNAATGAVHAAAWADSEGDILLVREDIGRHNALDKLIGAMNHAGIEPDDGIALLTSRASYEMVVKAASAGICVMAAISAPTALAIELARSAGMTLVGFARPGSHNVYSRPERLRPDNGPRT